MQHSEIGMEGCCFLAINMAGVSSSTAYLNIYTFEPSILNTNDRHNISYRRMRANRN